MDLRINNTTVRYTVLSLLYCLGAYLLLCASPLYANPAPVVRDYVLPEEVQGGYLVSRSTADRSTTESSGRSSKQSASTSYKAFDGSTHAMVEHRGRHVQLLLPQGTSYFTADHIEELIDQLDLHYALYTELMQAEPAGSGLLFVAFVPETCGFGCGLLGARGIEILSDPLNYENIIRELDEGRLEAILVHEMVHNFDRYASHLHYLPDHAHAWTDMFEFFAPYRYARGSRNFEAPDDIFNSPVRAVWKDYVTDAQADWETCVKEQHCSDSGLTANNLWAMVYYRIESLHGIEALLDSFEFLTDYARSNPAPASAEEKEGVRILSLAAGAGTNIACYMDELKWPVADNIRSELQKRYGNAGPQCNDADGDGFSAINGDCDDNDPGRNILSQEIRGNGIDDDCDELVDEAGLIETEAGSKPDNFVSVVQTSLPFEVDASLSDSRDEDQFKFPLSATHRARVTLCSDGEFRGWVVALQPDGTFLEAPVWNSYQSKAGCTSNTFDYEDINSGRLMVMADESQGDYSLTVSAASGLSPDHSVYLRTEPKPGGGVILRVDDRDGLLASLGTDEVEFWISGGGVQIFRPFAPRMTVSLGPSQLPGLKAGSNYQVRIRPRKDGLPLAGFSAGRMFQYPSGASNLLALDSSYSGAWFDPAHDGEGFIVEMLENNSALVYWFTYDEHSNQRWMLGTGPVTANRIEIEQLYAASGGRFGSNFDPDDVVLQNKGSLSISFQGCSEAIANFSIGNTGGHQELSRLTDVYGHDCKTGASPPALDLTGSWYDPAHNGEGFIIEQLSASQALVVWFTYDAKGNASWLLSNGTVNGNEISFTELVQPEGGKFGRSFDPQAITRSPWGELSLELDCEGGKAIYTPSAPDYMAGSQQLIALTRLQDSGCL